MQARIIRVKGIGLSEQLAQSCIEQAKQFGINVVAVDGINGLEYQSHLDRLQIKPLKKFKKGRPGVYGCFLSHYYLWKECADSTEPYLILEHDGWFVRPLPNDIMLQFDHVLKLDAVNPYSITYPQTLEQQSNLSTTIYTIKHEDSAVADPVYYSRGAYAYIIKPTAAKLIINWIEQYGFLPADQQLRLDICDIKTITPTVVRLHPYFYNEGDIKKNSLTRNTDLL